MAGKSIALSLLFLGLLLLWQPAVSKKTQCTKTEECYFDCGHVFMDLSAFKNNSFKDVADKMGQNLFSYSPCGTFSEGDGCKNTHVCQITDFFAKASTIDVGSTETASLSPTGGPSSLLYNHTTKDGTTRWTEVKLVCASPNDVTSQHPRLTVFGEDSQTPRHYKMMLTSQETCFQVKGQTTTNPQNVTTEVTTKTTPSKVTTKVTTVVTTAHHNTTVHHTTSGHNATTDNTTPGGSNATTTSHNATTEVTTPAGGNVTTAVMTTEVHNDTSTAYVPTANLTSPGHTNHTTPGFVTTTPSSSTKTSSSTTAVLTLMMPVVIALTSH